MYGAFGVKRRTIISTSFFRPIPLFDRGDHPFVPTRASFTSARAGAVKVGHRTNLAGLLRLCQATPGQLRARRHAWRDRDDDQRGARFRTRSIAPQPCIRWVQEPDHDAAMRIGSEAPRRRTHSSSRHDSHESPRDPATSNRHRRPVTSGRTGPKLSGAFSDLRSLRRAQNDAVRHHALPHQPPQGDQKLARQGHDHGLSSTASVLGAGSKPLRQGAVLLV